MLTKIGYAVWLFCLTIFYCVSSVAIFFWSLIKSFFKRDE